MRIHMSLNLGARRLSAAREALAEARSPRPQPARASPQPSHSPARGPVPLGFRASLSARPTPRPVNAAKSSTAPPPRGPSSPRSAPAANPFQGTSQNLERSSRDVSLPLHAYGASPERQRARADSHWTAATPPRIRPQSATATAGRPNAEHVSRHQLEARFQANERAWAAVAKQNALAAVERDGLKLVEHGSVRVQEPHKQARSALSERTRLTCQLVSCHEPTLRTRLPCTQSRPAVG